MLSPKSLLKYIVRGNVLREYVFFYLKGGGGLFSSSSESHLPAWEKARQIFVLT